ncbi:unnamed protein product [Rotaria sp. Silwood2]|nr:unnamed protein product [Rotaria sp. Silwood2]
MSSTNIVSKIVKSSFDPGLLPGIIRTSQTFNVLLADLNDFLVYLKQICAFILGFTSLNSIDINRFFADQSSYDSVERFVGDSRCQVLFVSQINPFTEYSSLIKRDVSADVSTSIVTSSSSSSSLNLYELSNEIYDINPKYLSLVVLKRSPTIVNDKNYHIQLQVIDFIDSNKHKVLFDELLDKQRIDLPEIILKTHAITAQDIKQLIGNVIQESMDNKNNVRTAIENRLNTPCTVRQIADPNYIFQPGEEFNVVFHTQGSYMWFQAWLSRAYSGCQHVLTIIEPAAFAMNIIV